jgi:hypothetical protein
MLVSAHNICKPLGAAYPERQVGDVLDGAAVVRGEDEDAVVVHPRLLQSVVNCSYSRICHQRMVHILVTFFYLCSNSQSQNKHLRHFNS